MADIIFRNKNKRLIKVGDLSDRYARIILARLGLHGDVGRSREEVCKYFDISMEKLQHIEEKAIGLLSK